LESTGRPKGRRYEFKSRAMSNEPYQATCHRPTQKEKTRRAFRAYVDLIDTAEWMKGELRGQLESFDLTMGGFRVLELLYREGPLAMSYAAEKRLCNRQNLDVIVKRLEERGWVERALVKLPPAEIKPSHLPKATRGKKREGRRIGYMRLTAQGEKFVGWVLPKHAKVVKSLMRVLDAREKESLSRICRKLREGDIVKYFSEIRHVDEEEELGARN